MTIQQRDTLEVQRYLDLLYPDALPDTWLVVSWVAANGQGCSRWFRLNQSEDAAAFISQAQSYNVYTGIGLRHPDCTPAADKRGESAEVYTLPWLWIEFDHNAGVHSATNLPTPDEFLAFIETLSASRSSWTVPVDITAMRSLRNHGYSTPPQNATRPPSCSGVFNARSRLRLQTHGWKVDSTADLARVLWPAGMLNHKSGTPKPVTILHEDASRYNPSDIADAPWLAAIEDTYTPSTDNGHFPPTQLDPIVNGCVWLQHCRDDACTLPEPEWYGMLGIIGRCVDGAQVAQEWSAPYPR
jgi:hypothetical protein